MKYLTPAIFFLISVIYTIPCFADCPPPSDDWVVDNNGTFTVNPPAGYTYGGQNYPITATGTVSLASATLFSSAGPVPTYDNVPIYQTNCTYGIGMTSPGSYPDGLFWIVSNSKYTTNLDSTAWHVVSTAPMSYDCEAYKTNCQFTGP